MLKKKLLGSACFGFIIIFISLLAFADVYMWKDEDGMVHITQTPPPAGAEIIKSVKEPTKTPTPTPRGQFKHKNKDYFEWRTFKKATPKPTIPGVNRNPILDRKESPSPTPHVDEFGHDEQWWKEHKQKLEVSLDKAKKGLQHIKDELRSYHQGSRRASQEKSLRNQKIKLEEKISQMETELEDLEYAVKKAGGLPGWVR
ncbi:DUF4124 domain-containing protein [candidate division CSSED10-310 bacterium]|uniref:DUF4124 domain-containing protein n=1 Tax=candidate division CSSED10-310 bacterium TaxID=2855610 RepID=A0ABV6YRF4_UNCC1